MLKPLTACFPRSLVTGSSWLTFMLLGLSVSTVLISIFISQVLLAAALFALLQDYLNSRNSSRALYGQGVAAAGPKAPTSALSGRWAIPSIAWPVLFFFAWTLLAALVGSDIAHGLTIAKKFFIFLLVFLVPLVARGHGRTLWIYHAVFITAAISSLVGLGQFIANPDRSMLNRISGFMSQWMTYSGLQMLVLVMLCAYATCFSWRRRWWVVPLWLLLSGSLYLSFTRNAWLGAVAGIGLVLLLKRPRAVLGFILFLLVLFLLAPADTRERLRAGLDMEDSTTRGRIELMETAWRLIRDNPWFGVGPRSVNTEALRYRGTHEYPDWLYQHMHNNFLQIAAERGIPGLLLWMWFMVQLVWHPLRHFRALSGPTAAAGPEPVETEATVASTAALGAWVALLVSGMFEYNFGDSEVLTLFLFVMSAPNAAFVRDGSAQAEGRSLQ